MCYRLQRNGYVSTSTHPAAGTATRDAGVWSQDGCNLSREVQHSVRKVSSGARTFHRFFSNRHPLDLSALALLLAFSYTLMFLFGEKLEQPRQSLL